MLCAHLPPHRSCTTVNALVTLVSALRAALTDGVGSALSLLFFSGLQVSAHTWYQHVARLADCIDSQPRRAARQHQKST